MDVSEYASRVIDARIDELWAELPAISIEGARGVGKTTTARQRAGTFLELDDAAVFEAVEADPAAVASFAPPVIVDEWQRLPPVFDAVRRAVDADRSPGRFLITGSASPRRPPTHTGAGRIVTLRMRPLALCERWDAEAFGAPTVSLAALLSGERAPVEGHSAARLADYISEIAASGLPGLRGLSPDAAAESLAGYIDRIIDRDFPDAGMSLRNPEGLRRWMAAYAAATATTASYERIRDAATGGHGDKPSRSATAPYIDALERMHISEPLTAWAPTPNPLAKLATGPKHHLADPALAVALLGLDADGLRRGSGPAAPTVDQRPLLGRLFESLVALSLRVFAQRARASVHHLRRRSGDREIDFIVRARDDRVVAIEAKLSPTVSDNDVRHLHWLRRAIGPGLADAAVITTGPYAYRRRDGIAVIPAALLAP